VDKEQRQEVVREPYSERSFPHFDDYPTERRWCPRVKAYVVDGREREDRFGMEGMSR